MGVAHPAGEHRKDNNARKYKIERELNVRESLQLIVLSFLLWRPFVPSSLPPSTNVFFETDRLEMNPDN